MMHRRNFLRTASTAGLASIVLPLSSRPHASAAGDLLPTSGPQSEHADYPIAVFTKVFQTHTFEELADAVLQMEADGIEATVRRGGQIDPKTADEQLPKMISALASRDKRLLIAATDVTQADKETEAFLTTLAQNGVNHYRMGYYRYEKNKPRLAQLKEFASKARELYDLSRSLNLVALYQNHAGEHYVGNLLWDLAILFEGIPKESMGVAIDLRHLRVEISGSYLSAIESIRPHIRSIYCKDALREGSKAEKIIELPLGEGLVDESLFLNAFNGIAPAPLAVHVEYFGHHPIPVANIRPVIDAYRRDVNTLRQWLAKA